MNLTCFNAAELGDYKQVTATLWCDLGRHHVAGRLIGKVGRIDRCAGGGRCVDIRMHPEHALLETAKVVHARHNFLAGIAAFFEADAAKGVQVGHLRHKGIAGGGVYGGDASTNVEQIPHIGAHRLGGGPLLRIPAPATLGRPARHRMPRATTSQSTKSKNVAIKIIMVLFFRQSIPMISRRLLYTH